MSFIQKFFGFFGLKIEKIPTRLCGMCKDPLPEEPAVLVVNGGNDLHICETCEHILGLSDKAAKGRSVPVEDDTNGDESI